MKNILIMMVVAMLLAPCLLFGRGKAPDVDVAPQAEPVQEEAEQEVLREYTYIDYGTGDRGTVKIGGFNEAPSLKAKVAAGEIPAVNERLPEEPLVLKPLEKIGEYGGTLIKSRAVGWGIAITDRILYEFLVNYTTPYLAKIVPNVARDWKESADRRVFTFYLRKGMKWSDGQPFTSDDIVFWYEAIIKNDELYPSKPGSMITGGELGVVRKIDDYTVEFSFSEPHIMFVENMARWRPEPYAPAHYLKQFHPDYTSKEEIDKMMKSEDFDNWANFFKGKWSRGDPNYPTISAWKSVNNAKEEAIHIMERNPYYWKVDIEGNQVPYIDTLEHQTASSSDVWLLNAMAGELTYAQGAFIGGRANYSLLMQNREKGDYNLVTYIWPPNNMAAIFFNFQHEDSVIRELFLDKRFRVALSIAINRDEINEVIFDGEATPSQPTSSPGPPYHGEGPMFKRYLDYNPEKADKLLDEIGLTKRDSEGYRLRPDGKKLIISNTVGEQPEVAEMYKQYWKDVGIRVVNKATTYALMIAAEEAGKHELVTSGQVPGGRPMNIFTRGSLFPINKNWRVSMPWGTWLYTNGEEGVEPPEDVKRLYELYQEGIVETSEEKRTALIMEAFDIYTENLYNIGGFNQPDTSKYGLFKNNLRNAYKPDQPYAVELFSSVVSMWFFE